MALVDTLIRLTTGRALPSRAADGAEKFGRGGTYGEAHVLPAMPPKYVLADEGTYFVTPYNSTTSTGVFSPGTGVAEFSASTAFSDTRGFLVIKNTDTTMRLYLDYIKLLLGGTAPAGTTVLHFAGKRSSHSRESTTAAQRQVLSPVAVAGSAGNSVARVTAWVAAAAMAVPASAADDPIVFRASVPTSLGVTGDEYVLKFGASESVPGGSGLTAVRATAAARMMAYCPPVVIEPGQWLTIHRWWPTEATNFPAFELEMGHWER